MKKDFCYAYIKLSGDPVKGVQHVVYKRPGCSFEITESIPVEIGMKCTLDQPGNPYVFGEYEITKIEGNKIFVIPI